MVDPITASALTAATAATKALADQTFQAGKARMRHRPSDADRKAAYVRFQDAAAAHLSVVTMAAAVFSVQGLVNEPMRRRGAWEFRASSERAGGELGGALRELYMVCPQEVADAAEEITKALMMFDPMKGASGLEAPSQVLNAALIEYTRAVRVDLRYDLPYQTRWWQFRRPKRPATTTARVGVKTASRSADT